jgi:tetratricopeptide (TPR) repeat protein
MNSSAQILFKNALSHIQLKEFDKAQELLNKAMLTAPDDPDILRIMSVNSALQLKYGDALNLIDRVIAITPNNGLAHSNRGNILKELHRHEEAIESFDRAIDLLPQYAEAYSNKGNALQELHRFEEAITWYDKAIKLQPDYAEAYSNKGNALEWLHRHDEAMENFDRATAINPQYIDAYWHKALSQLASGNYELGWQNYEARWSKSHPVRFQYSNIPRLQSVQQASGSRILIWAEQGLGDTIQFCRYIKLLSEAGANITFAIPKALIATLESLSPYCALVESIDVASERFDYQSPLLSLPLVFGTTLETLPVAVPYLKASPEKINYFASLIRQTKALRVGLVWNGGFRVDHPELWDTNKRRNIDLELLAKLKDISSIDFYSLQKGDPAEAELRERKAELWPSIINMAGHLNDFSDTAALIENLDLIISVDTSSAHLAGALGKPVWILNRYDSCWRWVRGREDSPWYPTAKIYQQKQPGNWDEVIARVRFDLHTLMQKQRSTL